MPVPLGPGPGNILLGPRDPLPAWETMGNDSDEASDGDSVTGPFVSLQESRRWRGHRSYGVNMPVERGSRTRKGITSGKVTMCQSRCDGGLVLADPMDGSDCGSDFRVSGHCAVLSSSPIWPADPCFPSRPDAAVPGVLVDYSGVLAVHGLAFCSQEFGRVTAARLRPFR